MLLIIYINIIIPNCIVRSSSIYGFWSPICIFKTLYCLFFFDLRILITPLIYSRHCDVCSSSMYGFWSPICIFRTLCCLFFIELRILITQLYLQDIVFSVLHRITDSEYPFASSRHCDVCSSLIYGFWLPLCIFKTCCCLFFFDIRILITPLVSSRHYIVCSSLMYGFWLPLWYLQNIMLSVLLWNTDSDYPFGIFKTLCCLFFFEIRILITPLYLQDTILSALLWYTDSDYPFGIFCVVCSSLIYGFWLHLWYLQTTLINITTDMNNTGLNNRGEIADWLCTALTIWLI